MYHRGRHDRRSSNTDELQEAHHDCINTPAPFHFTLVNTLYRFFDLPQI
jgi:hypothetical protein